MFSFLPFSGKDYRVPIPFSLPTILTTSSAFVRDIPDARAGSDGFVVNVSVVGSANQIVGEYVEL